MDFLNANHRAPWGFVRDTDADWNVKVVTDEHNLVDWQVSPEHYADDRFFGRLKALGFDDRDELAAFVHALASVGAATDYDREAMAAMLATRDPPLADGSPTAADLDEFALAWMRDVHEFANLDHWQDAQDPDRTAFDRRLREFRQERPWLRRDLREAGTFDYRHPTDGSVVYYGHRIAPDESEELLFVGNMEGMTETVTPTELAGVDAEGWELVVASPDIEVTAADEPVTLPNSATVVFSR